MPASPVADRNETSAAAVAVRVPAAFFSMVLGLVGLAAAWRGASHAYTVSPWLADALLVVSAALWVALLAAQVVKAVTARGGLVAELEDPVQGSLAALAPASLLAIAAGVAVHYRDLAQVLFWIGAAAQVVHAVWIVGRWLSAPMEPGLLTPALYLPPVVGSLLAAAAAGAVDRTEVGWLFFGVGIVSWIVLATVLLVRHLSQGELPADLRPLLGLELAPPAFALVAWQSLQGAAPDSTSRSLLGVALFVALVLLRLVGRFREAPFTPAYWSFTFPLAALSAATFRVPSSAHGSVAGALALPLFIVVNAVVAVVAYKTVVAGSNGKLLR